MELVLGRRAAPPVDFQSAERGDSAEIDLHPRLFRWLRSPHRCVSIVDRQPGIAAAGGRLPQFFLWDCHGYLQFATVFSSGPVGNPSMKYAYQGVNRFVRSYGTMSKSARSPASELPPIHTV